MTNHITINKITIDPSWNMETLGSELTKFNKLAGISYSKKYVGTTKVYSKDVIKKIKVAEDESFTIRYIITKGPSPVTTVTYLMSAPGGSECVYSKQDYTKYTDLEKDLNYIVTQVKKF